MSKIKTVTLGCRFNFYESEVVKGMIESFDVDQDIVVINTCAVTHEATRKSKQAVRKALRENPNARVIVTGCALKTNQEELKSIEGISGFIQNEHKMEIESYSFISPRGPVINDIYKSKVSNIFEDRSRVFLQIQNGCDNFCSYCIIPFTRGKSKSVPINDIVRKVQYFVDKGFKEIVLSGIDITSYGKDLQNKLELSDVIEQILLHTPELQRVRISSLDPAGVTEKLFKIIVAEERILPHFHMSIQSGDNDVLRAMNRRHTREDVIDLCYKIRSARNDVLFGSDFIVGFPNETDDMFENTKRFIFEAGITFCHIFPFSPRKGTLAASLIGLPKNVIEDRARKLSKAAFEHRQEIFSSFIGQEVGVFIEKNERGFSYGKTNNFISVKIKGAFDPAIFMNGKVTAIEGDQIIVDVETPGREERI